MQATESEMIEASKQALAYDFIMNSSSEPDLAIKPAKLDDKKDKQ